MDKSSNIGSNLVRIIGYILFFAAFFLLLMRVDVFLKNQAIDECGRIATYERNIASENAKVSYPVTDRFEDCLLKKGIVKK